MFSSRWITWFTLLALCLTSFKGWDRSLAGQPIIPTPGPAPESAPAQVSEPPTVSLALAYSCRDTVGTTTRITSNGIWNTVLFAPEISGDGRFVVYQEAVRFHATGQYNYPEKLYLHDRQSGEETLITKGLNETEANGNSGIASISTDGHYIAYQSIASNLVISDTNETSDIFVYNRLTGQTERSSMASDGGQTNGPSNGAAISADGRYVAFDSEATNVVSGDTNGMKDIFLHDRLTDEIQRISLAPDGTQANGASATPAISADGRFVAFDSWANNLVSGDTNETRDVFIYDRLSDTTTLVSVTTDGVQGNRDSVHAHLSANGRFVAFLSEASNLVNDDLNGVLDVFVHDRLSGVTQRVSVASNSTQANGMSEEFNISADGHFVVFSSWASNLVEGDTNNVSDIFVHDLLTGSTSRASVASDVMQPGNVSFDPAISADGRFVIFESSDNYYDPHNIWDIYMYDQGPQGQNVEAWFNVEPKGGLAPLIVTFTNQSYGNFTSTLWDFGDGVTSTLLSPSHTYMAPGAYTITLTASGPGGTNSVTCPSHVLTYNHLGHLARASLASDGTQADGDSKFSSVSADGRFVAFDSKATNLVYGDTNGMPDIFVHDRQSGETARASLVSGGSQGNSSSDYSAISADGRFMVFPSWSDNLIAGDTNKAADIFVYDRQSRETTLASIASDGTQSDGNSSTPAISAGGRFVTFYSIASNLVSGDTNNVEDIFVHDRKSGETQRASISPDGTQGDDWSGNPNISADGRLIVFASKASNLVSGDTNGWQDIFIRDMLNQETHRISVSSEGTQGNGDSYVPAISLDGRFVALESSANNLVAGDTNNADDIFVHDLKSGETRCVSLGSDGSQANGWSGHPSISADGRFVAFTSWADNLVYGDINEVTDIFVHDCQSGETRRASLASEGTQGDGNSDWPAISADGQVVSFQSAATNLVSDDTNGFKDIFVQDWDTQEPTNVHADFNASPLYGVNSLTVTFTNHTTCGGRDVACNVSTNLWFFGDGETSLQLSPTHTYTAPGVYNVTLFASGPGGTDSLTRNAYVVVRGQLSHYIPLVTR